VLTAEGQYEPADEALQKGLDITRALGGVHTNNFLHFLGDIDLQKGDHSRAQKIYEESVSILRGTGGKSFQAYPLRRLGYLALEQNDILSAWKYFQESLALNREVGDQRGVIACMASQAALALRLDKPVLAAQLLGKVESCLESLSINLLYLDQAEMERIRSQLITLLNEAAFTAAFTEDWEMSEEQVIELAQEILGAKVNGS
jgi:tetratricopeptide (TPR) repeat protein